MGNPRPELENSLLGKILAPSDDLGHGDYFVVLALND
jgi:hypothetical protein